jgi:hypothetical protein
MAKISNVAAYPDITPTLEDYVVITDQDTEDLETKTSTLADIQPLISSCDMDVYESRVKVTLTQLQNLRCSPVLLAPAPGPNKVNRVVNTLIYVNPGSVPFSGASHLWGIYVGRDPQCVSRTAGVSPYTVPESCFYGLSGGECYPYTDPPTYITAPGWDVPYMNCCAVRLTSILGVSDLSTPTPKVWTQGSSSNEVAPVNSAVYFWQQGYYQDGKPTEGDGYVGVSIKYKIMDLNCIK